MRANGKSITDVSEGAKAPERLGDTAHAPSPGRGSHKRKPAPPSLRQGHVNWFQAWDALDEAERTFVRECLKDGDLLRAARAAKHKRPFDLLGRKDVRCALLAAAPFTESYITARLTRPYILQELMFKSLEGDTQAAKLLLALDVKEPVGRASYSGRPGNPSPTESRTNVDDVE